jgi:signal peptidase I
MMTPRRNAAVLLALLVFVGWFAWFRPTALGGPANYIIVSGDSMEPTYQDGDLVVLRRAPSYNTGDIVAYPMKTHFDTGRLVIHRVAGKDEDGFITQGDNRESADPWRATDADIRGAAWAHIPKLGTYLAWLRQPWHLGWLAAGIFLVGGIGTAAPGRRRRNGMRRHLGGSNNQHGGGPSFGRYQPPLMAVTVAAAVVAVAFLLLGVLAFRAPTHTSSRVSEPAYTETGTFDYAIVMEPSTLYADGILLPKPETTRAAEDAGTPVSPPAAFTSLAREARVTFQYEMESEEQAALNGTVAADLVISPARGEWSRSAPLLGLEAFEGLSVTKPLTIDLVSVGALIARIEEETGLSGSPYELAVVARIDALGTRGGEPLQTSFESTFTLTYDRTLITPPSELTTTVPASSSEMVTTSKSLSLILWSPSVSVARSLAVVGFTTALGAALVFGGYLALRLASDEEARIRARYGSRLVDVQTEADRDEDSICVASIRDLSRLAERFGTVILHQPLPAGHRYFVRDGEDTYEYVSVGSASLGPASVPNMAGTPGSQGGAQ